jgi:TPP-dependent indolepyruvate ferredoxin oxidoreductase alpha subunit
LEFREFGVQEFHGGPMKCHVTPKADKQRLLMGNEAIGRGLVENGVTLASSYPGTPASE